MCTFVCTLTSQFNKCEFVTHKLTCCLSNGAVLVAEYDAQLSECAAVGGIDRIITLLLIQMNCIALLWRIVLIRVVVAGVRSIVFVCRSCCVFSYFSLFVCLFVCLFRRPLLCHSC